MNTMIKLEKENSKLREELASRDAQVESLKEQIRLFLHRKFSSSSEKTSPDQLGLFNEAESTAEESDLEEEPDTTIVTAHERKRKPRVSIPEELPREDIIHDLSEEDKVREESLLRLRKYSRKGKADVAINEIRKLYAIEGKTKDDAPDTRYRIRQEQSKPVLEKLRKWLDKGLLTVPPGTAVGKALSYMSNQWPRLVAYIDDGSYPIDNNAAERSILPFTIGRKNWLFEKSQAGAKASANIYSLVETAKANGLNPYEYLRYVLEVPPNLNGDDIESLLPWNIKLRPL